MTEPIFDDDRRDVYRLSIEYVGPSFVVAKPLEGHYRHARDQWFRAAQSIPLKIAKPESEYEYDDAAEPALSRPPEHGINCFVNGKSICRAR